MTMASAGLRPVIIAIAAVMVVAWVIAARYFVIIGLELRRARQAGEASDIPLGGRGLPAVVIFAKNALPRVERERRRRVYALAAFMSGWIAMPLLAIVFGR